MVESVLHLPGYLIMLKQPKSTNDFPGFITRVGVNPPFTPITKNPGDKVKMMVFMEIFNLLGKKTDHLILPNKNTCIAYIRVLYNKKNKPRSKRYQ